MRVKERVVIEEILQKLKPRTCLEWGAGDSTLYFPRFTGGGHWQSIEHDESWWKTIQSTNRNENVRIEHVKADYELESSGFHDGDEAEYKSYIGRPVGSYDFILVDGRARTHCLRRAEQLVSPNGVVILHDANRATYQDGIQSSRFQHKLRLSDGRTDSGGIFIASNRNIDELLDTKNQTDIWSLYRAFGL